MEQKSRATKELKKLKTESSSSKIKLDYGTYLRNLRASRGITLREWCLRYKFDPGDWSRVERHLVFPPSLKRMEPVFKDMKLTKAERDQLANLQAEFDIRVIDHLIRLP